jgi:hypothetical protein
MYGAKFSSCANRVFPAFLAAPALLSLLADAQHVGTTPNRSFLLVAAPQAEHSQSAPTAIRVIPVKGSSYLLVHDCTVGLQCRELGATESLATVEGFSFFSIFSTGIDPTEPHNVVLKISGREIPGALNRLFADSTNRQRFNFIVDLQKHRGVGAINVRNIKVVVDGVVITEISH